jgi:hypothetical protein
MHRRALAACLLALAALTGCGAGAGDTPDEAKLTVTDDFGRRTLIERRAPQIRGEDTVMRLLQRNARVSTAYGGGFVQSIEGVRGGDRVDWFYFVNGVLADKGAAATTVRDGDRIWWDRHDWTVTNRVRAVVGSFPEPFVNGYEGERRAVRVECDQAVKPACDAVQKKLNDLGLAAGQSLLGAEGGVENLRVVVGRWPEVRQDRALRLIEEGPAESGVYARVDPAGREISALDARGRVVRRLGAGTGLVAATRYREEAPTWVVTGTDADGLKVAADGFDESVLAEKYALAISDGLPVALPAVREGA